MSKYPTPRRCDMCENFEGYDPDGWGKCKILTERVRGMPNHCDIYKKKTK